MGRGEKALASLLDGEASGGDIAEGGFTFQEHMLVARVPGWLRREGFSEMIREALGDAEARFFVPGMAETRREFVEYKKHQVTPAEFWKEVERFQALDVGTPNTYERFVLVCRGESKGLQHILSALRRVRDAFPFYSGADAIQDTSYGAFVTVVNNAGRSDEVTAFLFAKVFVESDAPSAETLPREVFGGALRAHYPECSRLAGEQVDAAFENLRSLVKSRKNQPITRAELEQAVWGRVPKEIRPDRKSVRIITATEPVVDRSTATELVFDWAEFSGGGDRSYPGVAAWKRMRLGLQATKDWLVATGRPRRISLGGSRGLSGSLCIGSIFSAVSGFALEMDYRGEIWRTDEYGGPAYEWEVERVGEERRIEIAVAIGILKDIGADVARFLKKEGRMSELQLVLRGSEALSGSAAANSAVATAKRAIAWELSATGAQVLHLFVAGPAPFALLFGHRLNAVGEVQCYERDGEGSYLATCRFST